MKESVDSNNKLMNSMISYPNYKYIFPIKALGMFAQRFGDVRVL